MKHILNYKTFESTAAFPWQKQYNDWQEKNKKDIEGLEPSKKLFKFKEDSIKAQEWDPAWTTPFQKLQNSVHEDEAGRHQLGEYGHGFNHR
jgi:hypothetical protein